MIVCIPSNLSPSVPASAGSTSESSWHAALAASAWWKGKSSRPGVWSTRCKRASWLHALCSSAICETSMLGRFVDWWTSSLAATRANPSASPASGRAPTIRGTCGLSSSASSTSASPGPVSSRTSQGTCHSVCPKSLLLCGGAGTSCLDRACCKPQTWERPTSESGCSYSRWPTATATDYTGSRNTGKGNPGITLTEATTTWPTPKAHDEKGPKKRETWEAQKATGHGCSDLNTSAAHWPTPGANDHKGTSKPGQRRGQLDEATEQLFRPDQATTKHGSGSRNTTPASPRQSLIQTISSIYALPCDEASEAWDRAMSDLGEDLPHGVLTRLLQRLAKRRLNPAFVEWLMGLPNGLTDPTGCAVSATQSSLYRQRLRFELSRLAGDVAVTRNLANTGNGGGNGSKASEVLLTNLCACR